MIQNKTLGTSKIEIAPLIFGTNVFGWTTDQKMTSSLLDAFIDAGFNTLDTADIYSKWVQGNKGGESELAIGRWLKESGRRDQVVLATKVGAEISESEKGLSKKYIIKAAEDSLTRLQTDYIDLYQSHYDDLNTPLEETLEAYDILIKAGKVRIIGASNFTPERLEQSLRISSLNNLPAYQSFQPEYNLYDRHDFETNLKPITEKNNISVISYFSLASGFLTGKYRSKEDLSESKRSAFVEKYLNQKGFKILKALDDTAAKHSSVPGTIALAWVMHQSSITAPIVSATNLGQLSELLNAVRIQLDPEDLALLDAASFNRS